MNISACRFLLIISLLGLVTPPARAADTTQPSAIKSDFGKMRDGRAVDLFTLTNRNGLVAKVTNYGAILAELHVPDKSGKMADIVLGYDNFAQYETDGNVLGASIGRVINRINGAAFTLDGHDYKLTSNIHGGRQNFSKRLWRGETRQDADGVAVVLQYTAADGEEGFPGKMDCTITFTLTDKNELKLEYQAVTDKPTLVNLSNHSYFNLAGAGSGDVRKTVLMIPAEKYLITDRQTMPTGEITPVDGKPVDFRKAKEIGQDIDKVNGYDHCFILNRSGDGLALAATAVEPASGRVMEVFTTQPAVQLYTANGLRNVRGIGGTYTRYSALCLETEHYPDAIHHPDFPTTVLRPGEMFKQLTVFRFSTGD